MTPTLRNGGRLFAFALVLLAGCAAPHRSTVTSRQIWLYQGRQDGLVRVEKWRDKDGGGGWFLLTDPTVQSIKVIHRNQTDIGGGSTFSMGPSSLVVDPQAAAVIGAAGTAVGNAAAAIGKAAAGVP